MFEKFGELNSFGEINELAENLFNEGDTEGLKAMAKEMRIQNHALGIEFMLQACFYISVFYLFLEFGIEFLKTAKMMIILKSHIIWEILISIQGLQEMIIL